MSSGRPALLTEDEIAAGLTALPDWSREGNSIVRTVEAASFPAAIRIVDSIAVTSEQMDHHPDIDIRWRTLRFVLLTYSEGGLTSLDFTLAARIDEAVRAES
ncbi:4a-hydroxytetrahydrobiopterin dehydratase [Kitasatospora sp. NPDC056138]|uniref:4a-hydroxytetrahydrobiopterin dehydratase n=1 Tax=Kitasatospora sp. NPDC056138 TaxID=3345724 RepID=UPI0035DA9A53